VEFRIWKQGKVNLDLLTKHLQSAIHHAFWDLHMEYRLLTAPLAQESGAGKKLLIISCKLLIANIILGETPLLDSPSVGENIMTVRKLFAMYSSKSSC